ncbi:MAG: hypothetical protein A2Y62_14485 [Candidatus Fischerbacteria bacterium RBG_13_37_8]|uniref:Uncharacterized protein n=1 Tax=Candidatus Fischerbacteria bacterium RBG_13_37_8 TaxID=1817863 RepID=A0A1F5VNP3_9BACT|nr:MAG: hypothetical protein A2Y62_14485 [Candidatus Fischerbacteria bacterium RBG_13_37_8]
MWATREWDNVDVSLIPSITLEQAVEIGFTYIGGQQQNDQFIELPHLEIIPFSRDGWDGTIGEGYEYHLVWAFSFRRPNYLNTWEFLVEAHSGELLALQDTNYYTTKKITGAIYPYTNDGCGVEGKAMMTPMIFADTGFSPPNQHTNLGGIYDYIAGWAITNLYGLYSNICDVSANDCTEYTGCSPIYEYSNTGDIDLEGRDGEHDKDYPLGHSEGDTFSTRTVTYELGYLNAIARGWLNSQESNHFLDMQLTSRVNDCGISCNASYWIDDNMFLFGRSTDECGNTGEILSLIDHEWGHALDEHDANGTAMNPTEAFPDIVANYRTYGSCVGRGLCIGLTTNYCYKPGFYCTAWHCPVQNSDSHFGHNCYQYGDCCSDCTEIRDSDYAKHASGMPHTISNWSCPVCGGIPHCAAIPVTEAAWDLVMRDLQSFPFNYDKNTAFEIGQRLLYTGSGNILNWYSSNCSSPDPYSGCNADSGYKQWLAADDDNGDINDGTRRI